MEGLTSMTHPHLEPCSLILPGNIKPFFHISFFHTYGCLSINREKPSYKPHPGRNKLGEFE